MQIAGGDILFRDNFARTFFDGRKQVKTEYMTVLQFLHNLYFLLSLLFIQ